MITEKSSPRPLLLFEVLEQVSKESSRKKKIEVLQKHDNTPLRDYLRCVFDDRVKFNLPEGEPPYIECKEESHPSNWGKQHKKLRYLVKGMDSDKMMPVKREAIFIGMLESVHPKEARVLVDMINKKSSAKGLTKKLVQEAFPNLVK